MQVKSGQALAGFAFIIQGTIVYFDEWDYKYGFYVPQSTGIIICIVGLLIFISAFINGKSKKSEEKFLICKECKNIYPQKDVLVRVCPICSNKLIEHQK